MNRQDSAVHLRIWAPLPLSDLRRKHTQTTVVCTHLTSWLFWVRVSSLWSLYWLMIVCLGGLGWDLCMCKCRSLSSTQDGVRSPGTSVKERPPWVLGTKIGLFATALWSSYLLSHLSSLVIFFFILGFKDSLEILIMAHTSVHINFTHYISLDSFTPFLYMGTKAQRC